jgi:phospholipid/cholesterol/gamma-HCH transport system permease protein
MTARSWPIRTLSGLGESFAGTTPGQILRMGFRTVTCLFDGPNTTVRQVWDILVQQVFFTGVETAPIAAMLALLLGGVTIVEAATVMPRFGSGEYLGAVMVLVVLRELSPLFVAFLIAGRSGSALASYLGTMKVGQEIDALESMGIDPVRYLVLPALLGCTVATVCLSLLFSAIAIMGGYGMASVIGAFLPQLGALHLPFGLFVVKMASALTPADAFILVLKPMTFGSLIALIACHHGLSVGISPHEVPQGTRKAVVQALVTVVVVDGLFAMFFILPQLADLVP